MDKMFYSLEEAAAKLGKSPEDVRQMASRGQLQEFRDRDKLMFKREQVDLLAGGEEEGGMIPLASDSGELSLSSSGTGMRMSDSKESSAISIFEADATDESDANAVTRVSSTGAAGFRDPGMSGSGTGGLLDLNKEADDTSLGAGLMEDVYASDTVAQQTTADLPGQSGEAGALFETPGASDTEPTTTTVLVTQEAYDGTWSGIAGGLAAGMAVAMLVAAFALIMGFTSSAGGGMVSMIGNNFMVFVGVAVGVPIVFALVGMMLGRRG